MDTEEEKRRFEEDGYVIIRGLLPAAELERLVRHAEGSRLLQENRYGRRDGEGGRTKLALWNNVAPDVTGVIARTDKVAGRTERLLGGEVYHYHAKLIMKDARTGGSFVWHQDYGYWYEYGCLFPDMATVFIALDKADQGNGCLKVLKGSHRAGRVEHKVVGDQAGADMERVQQLQRVCELVHLELEAGDACFFHSNLLHRSEQNHSDRRRWAYLIAYNRRSNNPVSYKSHPQYTPLHKLPDSAILESPEQEPEEDAQQDAAGMDFFRGPAVDSSLQSLSNRSVTNA